MRILITRPEADAKVLQAHLTGQGHEVFIEPLIDIKFDNCDEAFIDEAQCLVATSRNAIRALSQSSAFDQALGMPLFVVGPGSAATAKALGFQNVIEGSGTAAGLLDLVAELAEVNGGPVVCLAGDQRAFDMAGELQRLGFQVLSPVVYRTEAAQAMTPRLIERLEAGEIDCVMLFSPRTASSYVRLLRAHNILETVDEVCHICLSQSVAQQLAPLGCGRVLVARQPNLREVLALLTP